MAAARVLMALASASALAAAAAGLPTVLDAGPDRVMAETWRFYGFGVFAALFALLAWRPLRYRWVWEIVIANKALLAVTAAAFAAGALGPDGVAGAGAAATADSVLAAVTLAAYLLCRGWRAGPRGADAGGAPPAP
ncbi:hypothetical protein [Streptomonospora salina]|uniref:Uncharacterized protein n=1 Tax=Streptomonospora salina TaxID=104205 RepID=A0A841ENK4_9ACTN|nr:hypothetical protein [Streptomonospora salina]MBB6001001.1 hypothetical protein [Streptomonospora salina]